MKNVPSFKTFVLAAAVSLGLASASFAQSANVAVPNPADAKPTGLLGQSYTTLGYSYVDFDATSIHASRYSLAANQSLREGLDGILEYGYARSSKFAGTRLTQHDLMAGARAFLTAGGIKPYVEAGIGWVWQKAAGVSEDSFAWGAGVGAEFEVVSSVTVTPYVRYEDITRGSDNDSWNYGVKANYWLSSRVGLQAGVERDDDKNMTYSVGANIRF
ncbi:MAG: porin [Opitutae bacterium]|nr:porin [Opitutae bacterium]